MQFLERLELLFGFLLFLSRLAVNNLVTNFLTDIGGEFVNRLDENTLVGETLLSAVDVSDFGIGEGVIPATVVGGVAKAVPRPSSVATESDFLAIDLCSEVLNISLLDHSSGVLITLQR